MTRVIGGGEESIYFWIYRCIGLSSRRSGGVRLTTGARREGHRVTLAHTWGGIEVLEDGYTPLHPVRGIRVRVRLLGSKGSGDTGQTGSGFGYYGAGSGARWAWR